MNILKLSFGRNKLTKAVVIISIILVFLIVTILAINSHIQTSTRHRIISVQEAINLEVDCILVLGAGVWEGERPSFMLEDRLLTGIELYKKGASNRLLMSGDNGRIDYDEVNVMKEFAINKDILSEHIFMDHAGFSTYESMYRARDIFQAKNIIVVTQEYHLYRAIYIADRLGLEAYGVASNPRQYLGQEYRDLREILARTKDFLKVIIKPKPTYLGETIPVFGDGNLTNDKD